VGPAMLLASGVTTQANVLLEVVDGAVQLYG
jgi:hypothetical protein